MGDDSSSQKLKIKGICESLASINVAVDDDDKVEVCLRGLTPHTSHLRRPFKLGRIYPIFQNWCPC